MATYAVHQSVRRFHLNHLRSCVILNSYPYAGTLHVPSSYRSSHHGISNTSELLSCIHSSDHLQRRFYHTFTKICQSLRRQKVLSSGCHNETLNFYSSTVETIGKEMTRYGYATSALYVRHGDENVAVVEVDLDLETRLRDIQKLEANLHARGMSKAINVYTLATDYKTLKDMRDKRKKLESEREEIANAIKDIVKNKAKQRDEAEMKSLVTRGKVLREKVKSLQNIQWKVEAEVTLRALKLPTVLHSSTPEEDTVIEEYGEKPAFKFRVKSHIELGRRTKTLKLSPISEGAYYLRNETAVLELDLTDLVSNILRQQGLIQFSNPDMVKTIVMESCGQEFADPEKVYTIQAKQSDRRAQEERGKEEEDKLDITLHLCGGASPYGFAAYLAKMNIDEDSLPIKAFSVGRSYSPARMERVVQRVRPPSQLHYAVTKLGPDTEMKNITKGLYSVPQATRIELFGACQTAEESTALYEEYTALLWDMYKRYDLPIRMVQMGPQSLGIQEGARREIQAWVPSLKEYKKVASVGVWNDFVSRRLMIRSHSQDSTSRRTYLHTVHGTALSVPQFSCCPDGE